MNVLQINTFDRYGGAEKIAWDLFTGYRDRGHKSWLAVGGKRSGDADVLEYHGTLWREPPSDALVFAMRQILGVYPPGTRPVTRQAVDALVEAVGEFVIRNEMNGIEAEEVRRDVGGQLIRFADTCQPDLAEHAVQCGVELMKDPVCDTLLAQQGVLRARARELQHDLEAIRTSRVWRLATGWYALRARLRRPGKRVRQAAVVAGDQGAVVRGDKVLFISHTAMPSGAPSLLLTFLRWFKESGGADFEVLLKEGGDWESRFAELAPVMIWNGSREQRERLEQRGFGLVFSNTMTNGRLLDELGFLGVPVVTQAHELDFWMRNLTDRRDMDGTLARTSSFVAVSAAVKHALVEQWGVPQERVEIVSGFVPLPDPSPTAAGHQVRQELGIPESAVVVAASGGSTWWKGADLFPRLAAAVLRIDPSVITHFVWIGGDWDGMGRGMLRHDVAALGLAGRVHFLGWRPNPLDFYRAADVFALMSRADSFPLVMLEAASVGTPILCFAGSGGAPEFVGADSGFVLPYLDVEAMAARIVELSRSPDLRRRLGFAAAEKVRSTYDVRIRAPQLLATIRTALNQGAGRPVGSAAG